MRIIGGIHKGYKLRQPRLSPTRPTTDISKEALFNIITNYFNYENVSFLDLFSGTGNHSYEFASRGCEDITSVELFGDAIEFIKFTSEKLEIQNHKIIQSDVFSYIESCKKNYDIIFAGPPYKMPKLETLPDIVISNGLILDKGWFILEHDPNYDFKDHPNLWSNRNYGQTNFSIFVNEKVNE